MVEVTPEVMPTAPQHQNHLSHDNHVRFTIDDVMPNKWREILFSFSAWLTADNETYELTMVYKRFIISS